MLREILSLSKNKIKSLMFLSKIKGKLNQVVKNQFLRPKIKLKSKIRIKVKPNLKCLPHLHILVKKDLRL
jgi:hypothetical protein